MRTGRSDRVAGVGAKEENGPFPSANDQSARHSIWKSLTKSYRCRRPQGVVRSVTVALAGGSSAADSTPGTRNHLCNEFRSACGMLNRTLKPCVADRPVTTPALVFPSQRSHAWADCEDRRLVGPTNFVAGVRGQESGVKWWD